MGLRSENRELFRTMTAGCSIISLLELVCTMRSIIIFIKRDWKNIRGSDYSDRRVLLVEDNDLNREIASEIIGMTGASVEIVENGREAVERIENASENWYDIVFMDVQMPVINGYEATAAIRALPGRRGQIPIIAMTANAFAEDVQLAKNTGMDEHIAKPLDFEKLNTVMEKYLN